MNLERYTEKTQNILQSSQTLALGKGHQRIVLRMFHENYK